MGHTCILVPVRGIAMAMLLTGTAFDSVASAQNKSELPKHYVLDQIRVFYAVDGPCAVAADDLDENGVPDQVEDVAKQLWAARHLFCEVLEFPDPFESERYKGVTCFQASLRDRSEMGGINGVAFESPQRARSIPEGKPTDRAIVMAISTQLDPKSNVTPTHELFHHVQYGATYFKKSWYLEGQARWAEHATAKEGIGDIKYSPRGPWPQKPQHLRQLAAMGSESEHVLWNPIAAHTDRDGRLTDEMLGEELRALRYSDGSRVLKDHSLRGAAIMREILIELGKQDDVAFEELQYDTWSEENQTSEQNNPYIYKAIMDALRRHDENVGPYNVPTPKR